MRVSMIANNFLNTTLLNTTSVIRQIIKIDNVRETTYRGNMSVLRNQLSSTNLKNKEMKVITSK